VNENIFWKIIDTIHDNHGNDMDGKSEELKKVISALSNVVNKLFRVQLMNPTHYPKKLLMTKLGFMKGTNTL